MFHFPITPQILSLSVQICKSKTHFSFYFQFSNSFENEYIANIEEVTPKPKRVKLKRKQHNKMHDENISFHHDKARKSDKIINDLSRRDGAATSITMALTDTTHENHR